MKPALVLDTRGLFCPLPVAKTAEAMRNLEPGAVLEVVADDPAIEFDLPAWCTSAGHRIVRSERKGEVFRFFIEKRGG